MHHEMRVVSVSSITIMDLPKEILTQIALYSYNPRITVVNRAFHEISCEYRFRAKWLLLHYGSENALGYAWDYGFLHSYAEQNSHKVSRPCSCATRANKSLQQAEEEMKLPVSKSYIQYIINRISKGFQHRQLSNDTLCPPAVASILSSGDSEKTLETNDLKQLIKCPLEMKQIETITYMIQKGSKIDALDNMTLCLAAKYGHLNLVAICLWMGASPEAIVGRKSMGRSKTSIIGDARWPFHQFRRKKRFAFESRQQQIEYLPPSSPTPTYNTANGGSLDAIARSAEMDEPEFEIDVDNDEVIEMEPRPILHQIAMAPPQRMLNGPDGMFDVGGATLFRDSESEFDQSVIKSLIYQSVKQNNVPLTRLLLGIDAERLEATTPTTISSKLPREFHHTVSPKALEAALNCAFLQNNIELIEILISDAGVKVTVEMVQDLICRAGLWRLALGTRTRFEQHLFLAIQGLAQPDFDTISAHFLRTCVEIGSPKPVAELYRRGVDVNLWNGLPLYASVYNGNFEVTKCLLSLPQIDVATFRHGQQLFCILLMVVELIAIAMFSSLVGLWGFWLRQTVVGSSDGADPERTTTLVQLTGMAVPSLLALTVMYHLVPLHRILYSLYIVLRERRSRRIQQLV